MFGHERGAFTGATERRIGRFELADTGTLFLDEVGDLQLEAQAKLLRVLESGEIQRIGAERSQRVDVRVLAATNRRLETAVANGAFREDLYFRLNVFPIEVPPLRDRIGDLPELVEHLAARLRPRNPPRFTPDAIAALARHHWPGNVRELANIVERLSIIGGDEVTGELVPRILQGASAVPAGASTASTPGAGGTAVICRQRHRTHRPARRIRTESHRRRTRVGRRQHRRSGPDAEDRSREPVPAHAAVADARRRRRRMMVRSATMLHLALAVLAAPLMVPRSGAAQVPTQPVPIGGPPGGPPTGSCLTDSILHAAVASFNGAAAARFTVGTIPKTMTVSGDVAVFGGSLRIDGTVSGNVIVINGDLAVTATARVDGSITVLGGISSINGAAFAQGRRFECDEPAPVMRLPDGTVALRRSSRNLFGLPSGATFGSGPVRAGLHLGLGTYNRVDGLPIDIHPDVVWQYNPQWSFAAHGTGEVRTASDPSGARSDFGWALRASATRNGPHPVTAGVDGGAMVVPTVDQPYAPVESGLSALLLRRDYNDWYQRKGGGVFASAVIVPHLTADAAWHLWRETDAAPARRLFAGAQQRGVASQPADRRRQVSRRLAGGDLDTRDRAGRAASGLWVRAEVSHVWSNDLTPVSLPTTIREAMPSSGYGETELAFDARWYLRLDPLQSLHFRVSGGGWLAGDPLTVQRRHAVGGGDLLPGYGFRAVDCDNRRRPDPARPALCDRSAGLQVEYRRTLNTDLTTRIGGYTVGLRRPAVVLFADAASAWLAGDSAGYVPRNRIQALGEWRSDGGIGIDGGWVGLYLAKAIADPNAVRFIIRLTRRF